MARGLLVREEVTTEVVADVSLRRCLALCCIPVACFPDTENPSGECVWAQNLWGLSFASPVACIFLAVSAKQSQRSQTPVYLSSSLLWCL